MAFKLLGSTDAASQSLGLMTEGIGFPLHPVEPSGGGSTIALTDNVTYTVGAGRDFETIDEAIAFINAAPIGAGNANAIFADTRIPRYTLALTAGTFLPTAPNGYIRLEGVTAQVAIIGVDSASTTLGDASTIIKITNCNNVRFDDITLVGALDMHGSHVLDGYVNYDTNYSDCALAVSHQSEFRAGGDITCKQLFVQYHSLYSGNSIVVNSAFDQPAILLDNGSVVSCGAVNVTMPGGVSSSAISCTGGAKICGSGALTLNGGAAGSPAVTVSYSGTVQTNGATVNNSLYDSVGNVPVGQIQADGSAIFDGVTAPTLAV
jgi:hypothetical protein